MSEHKPPVKRNTRQKEAVRLALAQATGFVTAQQLHQALQTLGSSVGLATVYRALADLAETGDADSITDSDGQMRFRACTTSHHHHLICRNCGKTVEIDADAVEAWAGQIAAAQGFGEVSHTIELFGTCRECLAR
jgi:Fur family ferric uptake transcriptional regulator